MTSKNEIQTAYRLAIILFIVGVVCYTAVSAKVTEKTVEPVRIMFKSDAGKVLFTHKVHTSDSGYGLACMDCHHHPEEDEIDTSACGDCHQSGDTADLKSCLECHEADEIEDTEMLKKADAFHGQCITCHQDFETEAGPVECADCHVM